MSAASQITSLCVGVSSLFKRVRDQAMVLFAYLAHVAEESRTTCEVDRLRKFEELGLRVRVRKRCVRFQRLCTS